jgi:Trk K+ transport system NAD-binding subunit
MKYLPAQLATLLTTAEDRRNVATLAKFLALLGAIIVTFSVLFHLIMLHIEGKQHSWITGFYWTLTVMTTLGFGDITFESDVGRLFSIVVLLSGVFLLLIVLPFTFIRFFYAPWLEARVRLRAPRTVPAGTSRHVVLCGYDAIAPGLIERLELNDIPYFVLEPDPVVASAMVGDGISVIAGEVDGSRTYERVRVADACLVVANRSDTVNTNIVLTVREVAPHVPIAAIVEEEDSIDIVALSGCSHVLPLKQRLGEMLANRINAGHAQAHVIGTLHGLEVAEFAVHDTGLAGKRIRDLQLRQAIGINFIGVWERGRMRPVTPDTLLDNSSVPVVVGTPEQIRALDELLVIYDTNYNPAIVIGGGKVGRAAVAAIRAREFPVHLVERSAQAAAPLHGLADRVIVGDAADRDVLRSAGIEQAPAVLLTTNDDAMNIYLAIYCRRLNPDLRIVSRITHERNIEAIHRAGADFVLSYAWLGVEHVMALARGRETMLLGEQTELFVEPVPGSLAEATLEESRIGDLTGLNVIAIERGGALETNPPATTRLAAGARLVVVGSVRQLEGFRKRFGAS